MGRSDSGKYAELRRRSEAVVGPAQDIRIELPHYELKRLVHELEVHQIELEMQNEELLSARSQLDASNQKYFELFDTAPVGYFTLNEQGNVEDVNLTGAQMLGVERRDLKGSPLSAYLSADDADGLYLHLQRVFESATAQAAELTLRPPNAAPIDVHLESICPRSENGDVRLCRTVMSDVSRLRHAERESVLQARAIENLSEGVIITESQPDWPEARIVFANRGMSRITGYAVEEMLGRTPALIHGPKTDPQVAAHIREQLQAGHSVRSEVIHHGKDGHPFEAELYVAPVRSEGEAITQYVAIYSDISGRKQLSRELLDRQARLTAVLETAVESIITIDDAGVIEDFNPAAEKLFGYRAEEVIGRKVNVLMPSPYREEHDGYLEAYRKTGDRKVIGSGREVEALRRDGSVVPVELSVSEFHVGGRPMFTGFIRDISERKAHEQESRIWQEELERRVEEGTRELQFANQELRELNFFISHDLKAPIRAVRNYTDLLTEDLEGKLEGEAAEDLRLLGQANEELHSMVEGLLVYSKLGQVRNLTLVEIDIRCLTHSIASQLTMKSKQRVIVEGELPNLRAPEILVRQIFQNLIENGLKYNESEKPEVRISAARREGEPASWEFTFRDNGIGIDAKHHEEIFRMFLRLHTADRYAGSGIGLAGVNKAAQLLGGTVRVESSPGEGSTFFVELPEQASG